MGFDTSEENQQSYFQNAFFSNFFGDIMSHIIRQHADEKIKYFFELFISKNFEYTFSLSFVIGLYVGAINIKWTDGNR